ncbi:CDP-diacylglycerol--glycerol-3-phosphate 3-phosphatidyltransferase [Amorphus orientalis]|uniref:CDP-diacylglycerol--glycerol-3-phosphate 3-phosphatidyltransferase n=1 Tax=Amorphus orientalis TaxID=649198 RepID=A0AAE4AVJ4_9HYPH|nr:CDP-diacylglycerol--glycerol-3-phosphate 3-phosphatidyltransferase [Amorphus orientalis]MDQ0316754.1 CDP-diacylglycerol--glycerol-3-phosphate 3-phosphatidyltransferase [Amorphus orientalis]
MTSRDALTIPNILTYVRIAAVPVVAALLLVPSETARWVAVILFVVAALSDYVDGYLARALNQTTALGRMLDPIADKLIVAALLVALAADGTIVGLHVLAAVFILMREIFVSGLREFLGGTVVIHVSQVAKWKTTMQLVAIAVLLVAPLLGSVAQAAEVVGLVVLWIAAALTVWTGYDYIRGGVPHIVEAE